MVHLDFPPPPPPQNYHKQCGYKNNWHAKFWGNMMHLKWPRESGWKNSLRSKRFLVVSEQRKTAERNLVPRTIFPGFGDGNEVARNHGWGTGFSVARCLPLVPCSLLRNYTETLARQATERPTFSNNSWKNHSDKQQRGKAGSCWRSGTAGKITLKIEGKADRTAMGW